MSADVRVDGVRKVTGRERYVADLRPDGCLVGKVLRSPLPHARITQIDVSRARRVPGVRAVLTGQDGENRLIGRILHDMPLLARDRVRFIGEKVAAVAAEDQASADQALALIDVQYEELPSVFDPLQAMQQDAPILHPEMRSYRGVPADLPDIPNLQSRILSQKGDLERGFTESEHIFEYTFSVPGVHQGYLEPHACIVSARSERIEVWASNKSPFKLRDILATFAGVPSDRVLVHVGALGGDFGGKGSFMDVPLCYALSAASGGAPVHMVMNYTDELLAANPRHAALIHIRTGVRADGRFWARDYQVIYNGGAYGAFKPVGHVNLNGAMQGGGAYRIPHVRMEGLCVYTNTTPRGHFRSPGEAQTLFAVESTTDMIAAELGTDPYELRRINAMLPGDTDARDHELEDLRLHEVLHAAIDASNWGQPKAAYVGRGIALFNRHLAEGTSSARVELSRKGLTLTTALADVGTGAHTTLREIVGRTMGVPAPTVQVNVGDTDAVPPDQGVGATRVTMLGGEAAQKATQTVKAKFLQRLAQVYGWPADQIVIKDGRVSAPDGSVIDFSNAIRGTVETEDDRIEATVTQSVDRSRHPTVATAQIAEVRVDPQTGEVTLLSFVSAHDVGEIFNPVLHQGQIDGGFAQGLGYALMEELREVDGRVETLSLAEYKLPTQRDVPPMKTVLVRGGRGPGPFGSKAIGESTLAGVAPAIANAIFDAVGARVTSLPLSAEKIRTALIEPGVIRSAHSV